MIDLDVRGDVTVVRLRAGKANAMGPALLAAIPEALDRAAGARALVITGEGKAFSAGLALPELVDLDRPAMRAFIDAFAVAMRRVLEHPAPTIAAVNGHAIAGGCVLALMCDARIGADGALRIGLNEVQLGIGLPAVVVEPLRHRVVPMWLGAIAIGGGLFDTDTALEYGLLDTAVPAEDLEARAIERAAELARGAPLAIAQVKRALVRPMIEAIDRVGEAEREAWLDTWFSDEGQRRLRDAVARLRK